MNTNLDIDLNIENYNFNDLIKLFNLKNNFTDNELRNCYKIVVQTHPDKSGLDKKYFLFYTQAFKILKKVYEYNNKKSSVLNEAKSKIEYIGLSEDEKGKQLLIKELQEKRPSEFNKWFNSTFESLNLNNDSNDGYGEWLKSDEGLIGYDDGAEKCGSMNQLHATINSKKQSLCALIPKQEIKEYNNLGNNCSLDSNIKEYSSGIFNKLQYDDLKKVHLESIIPVCESDYEKIKKFKSADDLIHYRNIQELKPISKEKANEDLKNYYNNLNKESCELAYRLTKQAEEAEKKNELLWNSLRSLK
jgi:curved DNA-binding protein CbpA